MDLELRYRIVYNEWLRLNVEYLDNQQKLAQLSAKRAASWDALEKIARQLPTEVMERLAAEQFTRESLGKR